MKNRIANSFLNELIEGDGTLKHSGLPPNEMGILRLALDLKEAREEIQNLNKKLNYVQSSINQP